MQPKVSYAVDAVAIGANDCELGDEVAVVGTSRDPECRLRARVVRCVRTFGDAVTCHVTNGTAQEADYAQASELSAQVVQLQDDVAGIDGNMSVVTSTTHVTETVTEAIDELDDLGDLDF